MKSPAPMRAAILKAHGAPFRLARIPRPEPGSGEVLVRIHASGVNPLDVKIHAGAADHARHPLPAILGLDLAGVVEAVGTGVTRFRPGDEVYGMTGGVGGHQGSLAEFAAVDADLLARKPANLDMREAAALPLVFITAWEGLVDHAGVSAGRKVLVMGWRRRWTYRHPGRSGVRGRCVRHRLGTQARGHRAVRRHLHRPPGRDGRGVCRSVHGWSGLRSGLRHGRRGHA